MIVSDACTLILLAKSMLLKTYTQNLTGKIRIPNAVYVEATKGKQTEDAKLIEGYIKKNDIIVQTVRDSKKAEKLYLDFSIGKGEAEAICLCLEEKGVLITDDRKAIQLCKLFEIEFTTALNILVALYKKQKIKREEATAMLEQLALHGRYSQPLLIQARGEII